MARTSKAGRNNTSHIRSNIRYFLEDLNFEDVSRKSLLIKNRRHYDYPLEDAPGFAKLYKAILENPKITEYTKESGEKIRIKRDVNKKENSFMLGAGLLNQQGEQRLIFLYVIKPHGKRVKGKISISFNAFCSEEDFEILRKDLYELVKDFKN